MSTFYEIPTQSRPHQSQVTFPDGTVYNLRLIYIFDHDPCWLLDISDALGNPILCGVPLVTGADLLGQFAYLGFDVSMYAFTDGDTNAPPAWWNLGTTAHLLIAQ